MMLNAKQVAEKIGVSAHTVREMCKDGRLPGTNVARSGSSRATWRIDDKVLREWRAAQRNGHAGLPPAVTDSGTAVAAAGYIDADEAARRLGMTSSGILYRAKRGTLPSQRVGRRVYVLASALTPKSNPAPVAQAPVAAEERPAGRIMQLLEDMAARMERMEADLVVLRQAWG